MAVVITGSTITAPAGAIDAADLTGDLDASLLTGTLPALDGSALTGVGGSTNFGDIGTYAWGRPENTDHYDLDATVSSFYAVTGGISSLGGNPWRQSTAWGGTEEQTLMSGTWRLMGASGKLSGSSRATAGLWVRIS